MCKCHPSLVLIVNNLAALIRVKANLHNGELAVPGDQWLILLYKDYRYDPEDPWKGLLRSTILVLVSFPLSLPCISSLTSTCTRHLYCRPSSTYSCHLALWRKNPRRPIPEMLAYM